MTLLELLRQELPKRGGWPEGANFIAQEEGGGTWSFTFKPQKDEDDEWMDESHHGYHTKIGNLCEASDHATAIVPREQYEATSCEFRPLRTEAERAIDEMVRLSGVSIGAAKILYDAGYRK